jgi:hypothetical protein
MHFRDEPVNAWSILMKAVKAEMVFHQGEDEDTTGHAEGET